MTVGRGHVKQNGLKIERENAIVKRRLEVSLGKYSPICQLPWFSNRHLLFEEGLTSKHSASFLLDWLIPAQPGQPYLRTRLHRNIQLLSSNGSTSLCTVSSIDPPALVRFCLELSVLGRPCVTCIHRPSNEKKLAVDMWKGSPYLIDYSPWCATHEEIKIMPVFCKISFL